jgi:hypothetical protein
MIKIHKITSLMYTLSLNTQNRATVTRADAAVTRASGCRVPQMWLRLGDHNWTGEHSSVLDSDFKRHSNYSSNNK